METQNLIRYETQVKVFLNEVLVGNIKTEFGPDGSSFMWRYYPLGDTNGGDSFATLENCKSSLIGE